MRCCCSALACGRPPNVVAMVVEVDGVEERNKEGDGHEIATTRQVAWTFRHGLLCRTAAARSPKSDGMDRVASWWASVVNTHTMICKQRLGRPRPFTLQLHLGVLILTSLVLTTLLLSASSPTALTTPKRERTMANTSPAHPFGLTGKHVLITGAGGGLGRAIVSAFTEAGAIVSGADRDAALLADLPLAHKLVFDLTDAAACRSAIGDLEVAGAVPDVLVNNAGGSRADSLAALDEDGMWESEIATNLTSAYNVTRPVLKLMARSKDGSEGGGGSGEERRSRTGTIVFTSSVNALTHYGNPAYAAAKAGLIAYARSIAVELGGRGVRANVVCPGSVRTAAWDHREAGVLDAAARYYPIGRIIAPEDVANTIVFLASPLAAGISGVVVPVDGGLMAGNVPFVRDIIGSDI